MTTDPVTTLDDLAEVCSNAGLPEVAAPSGLRMWENDGVTVIGTGGGDQFLSIDILTKRTNPVAGWFAAWPMRVSASTVRHAISDVSHLAAAAQAAS